MMRIHIHQLTAPFFALQLIDAFDKANLEVLMGYKKYKILFILHLRLCRAADCTSGVDR